MSKRKFKKISYNDYQIIIDYYENADIDFITNFNRNQFDEISKIYSFKIMSFTNYKEIPLGEAFKKDEEDKFIYVHDDDSPTSVYNPIEIFGDIDEWYYVSAFMHNNQKDVIDDGYYKCDQLDGLIDCLKELKTHAGPNL